MPCSAASFQVFFTGRGVVTPGSSNFRSPEKCRLCLISFLLIFLDLGSFPAFSTFCLHSRYKAFSGGCFHLKAAFYQCIGWCYPREKRGGPTKYPRTIGPNSRPLLLCARFGSRRPCLQGGSFQNYYAVSNSSASSVILRSVMSYYVIRTTHPGDPISQSYNQLLHRNEVSLLLLL